MNGKASAFCSIPIPRFIIHLLLGSCWTVSIYIVCENIKINNKITRNQQSLQIFSAPRIRIHNMWFWPQNYWLI